MKRYHWFEIALIVVVIGVHLYAAFSTAQNFPQRWFTRDDAYYYFKVAQNISEGRGSTFDGTNPSNGYHPLWLAANVPIFALARFDLILPLRLLTMIMAALSAATSVMLFRLLRRVLAEPIAMLAAAFWAFDLSLHGIITQPGMETGILAFSVVFLLALLQKYELRWRTENRAATRQEIAWLALAALLPLFSRLDTIFLVLIIGIWIVFRGTPIRALLPADLLFTLSLIVAAFVQRAGLKIYLLDFAESAILTFGLVFVIQTLAFYFFGLYAHPKDIPPTRLLRRVGFAVGSAAALLGFSSLLGSFLGINIPRAVPLYYLVGMLLWALLSRWGYAALSPWPVSPFNESALPLEQLRLRWRAWLENGLTYYGIVGLALGGYMLLNRWLFGTFMPVSGQIKRWWGSLGDNTYGGASKSMLDIFGLDPQHSQPWELLFNTIQSVARQTPLDFWVVLAILAVMFIVVVLLNRQKSAAALTLLGLTPLAVSAGLHAAFYGAMPYAAKHEWYWVTQMLVIVIGLALFAQLLSARIRQQKWGPASLSIASLLLSLWLAWGFSNAIINRMTYTPSSDPAYMDVLTLLEQNTEPGAVIGMTGGGNVGYFIKDRTVVNMDGLINSYPYFKALQANQAPQYLFDNIGMDYIFANPYLLLSTAPYSYQFGGWIEEVPGLPFYGNKQILRFVAPGQ